jgi:hypothetical protein
MNVDEMGIKNPSWSLNFIVGAPGTVVLGGLIMAGKYW